MEQFKVAKGKQWTSRVKGAKKKETKTAKEQDVLIYIGLLEWKEKMCTLKPLRGKKLALRVSNTAKYSLLREKAEEKWRSFHSNLYDDELSYELLYEDGQKALFLPGSSELFSLQRYQEEVGKDFNKITLFLCSSDDYLRAFDKTECTGSDDSEEVVTKKVKFSLHSPPPTESSTSENDQGSSKFDSEMDGKHDNNLKGDRAVMLQIEQDEQLAKELQNQVNEENLLDYSSSADHPSSQNDLSSVESPSSLKNDLSSVEIPSSPSDTGSVVKAVQDRVDSSKQLFLVVRRGALFFRQLTLWQREVNRSSAEYVLRVCYHGEEGIDSGAMGKEFLTQMIQGIGSTMFPEGGPINSTYQIQNGNFRACGQIAAVSLAQGGPPPCFLEECVYNLLVNPDVDVKNLSPETHLTAADQSVINQIREDVTPHQEMIIEHGYTGKINQEHVEDIVQSIVISIVTRQVVIMKEFMEGLQLYGLAKIVLSNPEVCKTLFVKAAGAQDQVDANYLFSLVQPVYSAPGSSRRQVEESIMDHLQDFLISLEDEQNITGYASPVTWNYEDENESDQHPPQPTPELKPSGIMGWLTGQKHRPLNGEELVITASFDHDCFANNPNHKICFPNVRACAREITFPSAHMSTSEEFRNVFMIAYCKGQAFGRP